MSVHLRLVAITAFVFAGLAGCAGGTDSNSSGGEVDPPPQQAPGGGSGGDSGGDSSGDSGGGSQPDGEPTVSFDAADDTVASGATTVLSWSSTGASTCQASGGWTGQRATTGSATVGPLDSATTFTLSCSGDGGSAVAMLSVSVLGVVNLAWQPPAENEDGSPLTDLTGYRIYYGSFSRSYTDEVAVDDAATTQWNVELPTGDYYFAMTALDAEGNESGYSNEVRRAVN